jgi:hypothetical protein
LRIGLPPLFTDYERDIAIVVDDDNINLGAGGLEGMLAARIKAISE